MIRPRPRLRTTFAEGEWWYGLEVLKAFYREADVHIGSGAFKPLKWVEFRVRCLCGRELDLPEDELCRFADCGCGAFEGVKNEVEGKVGIEPVSIYEKVRRYTSFDPRMQPGQIYLTKRKRQEIKDRRLEAKQVRDELVERLSKLKPKRQRKRRVK